jgi:hypothetical protein
MTSSYARTVLACLVCCGGSQTKPEPVTKPPVITPDAGASAMKTVPLPGATGPVSVDLVACDRPRARVWVPVGDTGSVDVFDIATSTFTRVDGFKTAERVIRDKKRIMGPSAVTIGDGVAYVGNRATSEVCAVDLGTLKLVACLALPTPTDGLAYVASAKEVWVTTPKDQSLTVLDATDREKLKPKLVIKTEGSVEGYAVDEAHGVFYTNLEDKNRTLAVDVKTRTVKASWPSGCSDEGPRGVAVDVARGFVFVACTDGVRVLREGAQVGTLDAGAGVDNIEWVPETGLLYVAAGKAAKVTVARASDKGELTVVRTVATVEGARNAVVDAKGGVFVVDARAARLLVL